MNDARPPKMTLAEFLEWEDGQPLRYEFDGVKPVSRTGGSVGHASVQAGLAAAVGSRLRGGPCRFFGSNLKFLTAGGRVRYPDGMVICGPVDRHAKWLENPAIVFEVLSSSTTIVDRTVKAREYEETPSVTRYVMLEQDSAAAVVYSAGFREWTHEFVLADGRLELFEAGISFPLAEIYDGLEL